MRGRADRKVAGAYIPGCRDSYNRYVQDTAAVTPYRDLSLSAFTNRLASSEPVPGGGSASAVAAAIAASLVSMVAQLSLGRDRYAAHVELLTEARAQADALRERLLELAEEDADAYAAFARARKLPRDSESAADERRRAISVSARSASEVPLACLEACMSVAELTEITCRAEQRQRRLGPERGIASR